MLFAGLAAFNRKLTARNDSFECEMQWESIPTHRWCGQPGVSCDVSSQARVMEQYGAMHAKQAGNGGWPAAWHALGPWASLVFRDKPAWIAVMRDAVVSGLSGTITMGCRVMLSTHSSYVPVHRDALAPKVRLPTMVYRSLATVVQMSPGSFFHLVMEVLPRVVLLLPQLQKNPQLRLLVPHPLALKATAPFLEMMGIPAKRQIPYDPSQYNYKVSSYLPAASVCVWMSLCRHTLTLYRISISIRT